MRTVFGGFLLFVLGGTLSAQMTPAQRVEDFNVLTDLYAKRYAPWGWKVQALGFDLFQTAPWLAQIQNAKDDLEYFEIVEQYVASLQDTHSEFQVPSAFSADTGIAVDIYDGKVLIESINRLALPASQYPFQVGDEIVSVDGQTSEEIFSDAPELTFIHPRGEERGRAQIQAAFYRELIGEDSFYALRHN